jgi:OOP family OmpA-OmpF porin
MKTSFGKKQLGLAAACALALSVAAGTVQAQSFGPANERELWVTTNNQVWKNGFGECWHSAYGPPPPAGECNPAAPVAAAPAPTPYVAPYVAPAVVAAATPQPVYEKFTLDADALFDFDKAVLRPAGRDSLDRFVEGLKGINPTLISAEGHTDRFGTDAYNQDLSDRRAAAVKAYLVSKGVQSSQVQTSGKGETQPVTKMGDCRGAKNAKVVACLQPDRRVEIEVVGTQIVAN